MSGNQESIVKGLFYRLVVKINPDLKQINAEVIIQNPLDSVFYINKNFKILTLSANGRKIPFHLVPDETLPMSVGTAVRIDGEYSGVIVIEYTGTIDDVINNVNMIQPDLVELASYSAWYPIYKGMIHFGYELEINLPSSYITTTNGILMQSQAGNGSTRSTWRSSDSCFDIVIISSPKLTMLEQIRMGTRIELFHSQVPEAYMLEKMNILDTAIQRLSSFYGPSETGGILRCVNSPRSGWGYSRVPLFVMSEEYILSQLDQEHGRTRIFHDIIHELAHFWWRISDTSTPDDWINEGLAEFSAYRLSEEFFGKSFAATLAEEYREHAAQAQTSTSIVETLGTAEDRYVNRYEKTTLIYIEACERFDSKTIDGLFTALHKRFAQSVNATTKDFLDEVDIHMGSDASGFFRTALYQTEWLDPSKLPYTS